jgi:hypothetical protein
LGKFASEGSVNGCARLESGVFREERPHPENNAGIAATGAALSAVWRN